MTFAAVLDTNIFVSGIHWAGASEKVLNAWMEERFRLVSSIPIIDEVVKVLMAFKVPLEASEISWWENLILERSKLVFPEEKVDIIKDDSEDNKFIEAALEGEAGYIVSQDNHLLKVKEYRGIKIVPPYEFLELISQI